MPETLQMHGRVAIVTGAASGIGRATSRRLADRGALVAAIDIDGERLSLLLSEMQSEGLVLHAFQLDVASNEDSAHVVDQIMATFGRIDVLCNIAGVLDRTLMVHETTTDVWDRVLAVNLTGAFLLCRLTLPAMLAQGKGVIVNVSSVAGLRGGRAGAAYTVAKHGLIGLTRNIGIAYGGSGVRCVTVCPGATNARTRDVDGPVSEYGLPIVQRLAAIRPPEATADDIGQVIAFVASDQAKHLNATEIVVDGGWTCY